MTVNNNSASASSPAKSFKTPELVISGMTPDELRGLKDVFLGEFVKDLDRRTACDSVGLRPRELAILLRDDPEFRGQVDNIKGADDALLADKAREVLWDLLDTGSEAIKAQLLRHVETTRAGYGNKTKTEVTVREADSCHPVGIDPSKFKMKLVENAKAVKATPETHDPLPEDAPAPHRVEFV